MLPAALEDGYKGQRGICIRNCLKFYSTQKKGFPAKMCCFYTQRVRNRPHAQMHAAFSYSFSELSPVLKHFIKQVFNE